MSDINKDIMSDKPKKIYIKKNNKEINNDTNVSSVLL